MAAATDTNELRPLVLLMRTPDHPPYAEMICDAIISLREEGGSSEHSISKHIESTYLDLPVAHTNLLTYHISKLTRLGEILQPIPGFYTLTTHHYLQNPNPNPNFTLPRKRGRPPKSLHTTEPVALLCGPPRRSPRHNIHDPDLDLDLDLAPLETSIEPPRRGRGRGRGRPPLESGGEQPRKSRGRGRGRGRGRQAEFKAAGQDHGGQAPVRRRGRPPKAVAIDGGGTVGLLTGPTPIDGGEMPRSPKDKPKEAEAVRIETGERVDEVALLN